VSSNLANRLPVRDGPTVVRVLRRSDLDRFQCYRSDEALARYQAWTPMTVDQARAFLEAAAGVVDPVAGDWIQLGIAEAASDLLIGDLGLFLDGDGRTAEIGFTLNRDEQGRGHATRAVLIAVGLVFAATASTGIRAVTDARNLASIGVLERAGFRFASQQQAVFKGEPCIEFVYRRGRIRAPASARRTRPPAPPRRAAASRTRR
jgi:aminoglycoside 6'-N-acetyltransferase